MTLDKQVMRISWKSLKVELRSWVLSLSKMGNLLTYL